MVMVIVIVSESATRVYEVEFLHAWSQAQDSYQTLIAMGVVSEFMSSYRRTTPRRVQLIDVFLMFVLVTGLVQFLYCALVGTFPFNSFLAGFISTVGVFVLTGASPKCQCVCVCVCVLLQWFFSVS